MSDSVFNANGKLYICSRSSGAEFHALALIRKVLAHTVGVFLNLQLQRDPLDLDGLIAV
jgi:hypothetical protein